MNWFKEDILRLYAKPFLILFGITLFLYAANMGIYNYFVWSDELYAEQNGGVLNPKGIQAFRLVDSLRLVFSPIFLFLKIVWVAFIIQLILLLFGIKSSFRNSLKISAIGQNILVFGDICKTLFFLLISPTTNRNTIDLFYPFSLLNWIEDRVFAKEYLNMLMSVNIFEVMYMIAIGYLIHAVFAITKAKAIFIFGSVYILCLTIFYVGVWLIK